MFSIPNTFNQVSIFEFCFQQIILITLLRSLKNLSFDLTLVIVFPKIENSFYSNGVIFQPRLMKEGEPRGGEDGFWIGESVLNYASLSLHDFDRINAFQIFTSKSIRNRQLIMIALGLVCNINTNFKKCFLQDQVSSIWRSLNNICENVQFPIVVQLLISLCIRFVCK